MAEFEPSSPSDAVREHTRWVGAENPDSAWILSPFDTWERTPFYPGRANPRRPEDRDDDFCPENAYGECEYEYTDADGTVRTAKATQPVRSLRELGIDP